MLGPYAGPIPPDLGNLGAVKVLMLVGNELTGGFKPIKNQNEHLVFCLFLEQLHKSISVNNVPPTRSQGINCADFLSIRFRRVS